MATMSQLQQQLQLQQEQAQKSVFEEKTNGQVNKVCHRHHHVAIP